MSEHNEIVRNMAYYIRKLHEAYDKNVKSIQELSNFDNKTDEQIQARKEAIKILEANNEELQELCTKLQDAYDVLAPMQFRNTVIYAEKLNYIANYEKGGR